MLDPDDRALLLDALRPPPGFRLDAAVGTTYGLDLTALLTAPLAFALFEAEADDDAPDPLALLEAVRRHGESIDLFCEAGRIAVPADYQVVLAYLEGSVHEAVAPRGSFHPKAWVLRYADADGALRYRLLCPSRNLTFDRSWDVLVTLDGRAGEGGDAAAGRNAPVAAFLRRLPALARSPLPPARRARIAALADEVEGIDWELPDGFDEVAFWAPGVDGAAGWPFAEHDRALVISPFLAAPTLAALSEPGGGHVLVTRAEALDAVGAAAVAGFDETLVLTEEAVNPDATSGDDQGEPAGQADAAADAAADPPSDAEPDPRSDAEPDPRSDAEPAPAAGDGHDPDLSGLHAKVYLLERGGRTRLLAGSANATAAAFRGNVEFLVELGAPRGKVGIERQLRTERGVTTLRDLLVPYRPADAPAEETAEQRLEAALDRARSAIAGGAVRAGYAPDERGWRLDVTGEPTREVPADLALRCWPITLQRRDAAVAALDEGGWRAAIGGLSDRAVTPFLACEATLDVDGRRGSVAFAVRAELHGGPDDRLETVLTQLLDSHDDLLRLLALLLADGDDDVGAVDLAVAAQTGAGRALGLGQGPLFEALLRTLSRDPERLDHISRLLEDLRRTEEGAGLIPDELDAIWRPIWQVRQEPR